MGQSCVSYRKLYRTDNSISALPDPACFMHNGKAGSLANSQSFESSPTIGQVLHLRHMKVEASDLASLANRLFVQHVVQASSKSEIYVKGIAGPVADEFPSQCASNVKSISIL